MRFAARLITVFFLVLIFLFNLSKSSFAQNSYTAPVNNPDVPQNLHTYTQNVFIELMATVACQLTGYDPISQNHQCLGVDPKTGKIGFVPAAEPGQIGGGGVIGVLNNLITMTFNIPAHSFEYVNYLAQNFGIAKPALAQTTGFQQLNPLMNAWAAFRNMIYIVFVLVFILVGLAIMLRVKIDPRTVMTIQNQIPKMIIGIILVTFSFAIAGFLIDLMWVATYLIINLFANADPQIKLEIANQVNYQAPIYFDKNVNFVSMSWQAAGAIGTFIQSMLETGPGKILQGILGMLMMAGSVAAGVAAGSAIPIIGSIIGGIAGAVTAAGFAEKVLAGLGQLIAFLIIAVAITFAMFRLWFKLLLTYVGILIDIVLSPLFIVIGIIPFMGSERGFGSWLRSIGSKLIVFPTVVAMLLLGKVFIDAIQSTGANTFFTPPLVGNVGNADQLAAVVGLGIILLTPNVATMVEKMLKAPKFEMAPIGQAFHVGTSTLGKPTGYGWKQLTRPADYTRGAGPIRSLPIRLTQKYADNHKNSKIAQRLADGTKQWLGGEKAWGKQS